MVTAKEETMEVKQWAPVVGKWKLTPSNARFLGPQDSSAPHGIALSKHSFKRGSVSLTVDLNESEKGCGRILFGYHAASGGYFTAGIGGYDGAYCVDEFVPGKGWRALKVAGSSANLEKNHKYDMKVEIRGQGVQLSVDGITVVEATLPHPLRGNQIGLFAWGEAPVTFHLTAVAGRPQAFVVMQFGEPFDNLYREVIKPVAEEEDIGFAAHRAYDVFRPGVILQDIIRSIVSSDVVIAEVTPANPNVFYELGYAHAIDKPTILLAEHQTDPSKHLPFDISGFRVIFYDNTIRGKRNVETMLRQHLTNIKEGRLDSLPLN